jgi:hypothetical protein
MRRLFIITLLLAAAALAACGSGTPGGGGPGGAASERSTTSAAGDGQRSTTVTTDAPSRPAPEAPSTTATTAAPTTTAPAPSNPTTTATTAPATSGARYLCPEGDIDAVTALQEAVDQGHQPWRVSPEDVAAACTFGVPDSSVEPAGTNRYQVTNTTTGEQVLVTVAQPLGPGTVWAVTNVTPA